jgi:transposase
VSELQVPLAGLVTNLAPVWTGNQPLSPIPRGQANGQQEGIAAGVARLEPLTAVVAGVPIRWPERRLVIRSHQLAQAGERRLRARLAKAQAAMAALNDRRRGKRRVTELPALQAAVAALLARYHVQGVLQVRDTDQERWRPVRRYGDRPTRIRLERDWQVTVSVDAEAVGAAVRQLGWRVDATNAPPDHLALAQAVLAYRSPYRVESAIGRLKGHPWSVTPMYLERDDHATGLIRLLSVGWRVVTRLEYIVRQRLAAARTVLAGLYAGNPKRATAGPTTERLLNRFEGLTLTIIQEGRRRRSHLTPLSRVQRRILALLNFPVDISTRRCTRRCPDSHKPP